LVCSAWEAQTRPPDSRKDRPVRASPAFRGGRNQRLTDVASKVAKDVIA